jgi:hypothetical protein
MDENNIRDIASGIGNLLSKNQSLMTNTDSQNEEEYDDGADEIDSFD